MTRPSRAAAKKAISAMKQPPKRQSSKKSQRSSPRNPKGSAQKKEKRVKTKSSAKKKVIKIKAESSDDEEEDEEQNDFDSLNETKVMLAAPGLEVPPIGASKSRLKTYRGKRRSQVMRYKRRCDKVRPMLLKNHSALFTPFLRDDAKLKKTMEDDSIKSYVRTTAEYLKESPGYLRGKLRDYQMDGVNWIIHKFDSGVGCVLGDEMGLGKTFQTISFLSYLKHERNISGPHLVVVPLAVAQNWINEIRKWAPDLTYIKVQGSMAERDDLLTRYDVIYGTYDLTITTFETIQSEHDYFKSIKWLTLTVDEAHRLKSHTSRTHELMMEIKCPFQLLLTGTPLQNNLHELWGLFRFIFPDKEIGLCPKKFMRAFDLINEEISPEMLTKARDLLDTFMIRRTKTQVEPDLPPKTEVAIYLPLNPLQTRWYKRLLNKDAWVKNLLSYSQLMAIIMQLRKVCNHPTMLTFLSSSELEKKRLAEAKARRDAAMGNEVTVYKSRVDGGELAELKCETTEQLIKASSKMVVLDKLLHRLHAEGHRVLLFSQFTMMLDLLGKYLHSQEWKYKRMDGSTNRIIRELDMKDFNAKDSSFFTYLISTRAGGLGINLATADTVILFDSDWNPQNDLQAQARAHRIGQTNPVTVYRFLTESTVEEKLMQRAQKKLYLDAMVVGVSESTVDGLAEGEKDEQAEGAEQEVDEDEILNILKFGADKIFKSSGRDINEMSLDEILRQSEERDGMQVSAEDERPPDSLFSVQPELIAKDAPTPKEQRQEEAQQTQAAEEAAAQAAPASPPPLGRVRSRAPKKAFVPEDWRMAESAKKPKVLTESKCFHCKDGGELITCVNCPKVYHTECLSLKKVPPGSWYCPWHECVTCQKRSSRVGGIMFRCYRCPNAYCFDHWPSEDCTRLTGQNLLTAPFYQKLLKCNYQPKNVEYCLCLDCIEEDKQEERKQAEKENLRLQKIKEKEEREEMRRRGKEEKEIQRIEAQRRKAKERLEKQKAAQLAKMQATRKKLSETLRNRLNRPPTKAEIQAYMDEQAKLKAKRDAEKAKQAEKERKALLKQLKAKLKAKLKRNPNAEEMAAALAKHKDDEETRKAVERKEKLKEEQRFEAKVIEDLRLAGGRRTELSKEKIAEALKQARKKRRNQKAAEARRLKQEREIEEAMKAEAARKRKEKRLANKRAAEEKAAADAKAAAAAGGKGASAKKLKKKRKAAGDACAEKASKKAKTAKGGSKVANAKRKKAPGSALEGAAAGKKVSESGKKAKKPKVAEGDIYKKEYSSPSSRRAKLAGEILTQQSPAATAAGAGALPHTAPQPEAAVPAMLADAGAAADAPAPPASTAPINSV